MQKLAKTANRQENAVLNFGIRSKSYKWCRLFLLMYSKKKEAFMRTDILERKAEIAQWIAEGKSKAYMAIQLQCNPKTVTAVLKRLNFEYSGNQSGKGQSKKMPKLSLMDYLATSQDIQSNKVRIKLLEEGYKDYQCERCKMTTWMNEPIPLELHHKDGNRNNNTLQNYELLCPNCHALTESYRGKNCTK